MLFVPVHPRIRGERMRILRRVSSARGSSPHTRGTPACILAWCTRRRFIPAYAGNAPGCRPWPGGRPVHPRIRGERISSSESFSRMAGSSPHTRGTLVDLGDICLGDRFIPAYAGNAALILTGVAVIAVHPRIRGERGISCSPSFGGSGSSPHTRGTRALACAGGHRQRFIPAYAGNAGPMATTDRPVAVHPRIRGERVLMAARDVRKNGSSPHTRGTPDSRCPGRRSRRFIPAYAGNACGNHTGERPGAVHPRIRGERTLKF